MVTSTVFVVTSVEEMGVVAVFDTYEKAQQYAIDKGYIPSRYSSAAYSHYTQYEDGERIYEDDTLYITQFVVQ